MKKPSRVVENPNLTHFFINCCLATMEIEKIEKYVDLYVDKFYVHTMSGTYFLSRLNGFLKQKCLDN